MKVEKGEKNMVQTLKKILGEISGVDYRSISNDMHIKDDLYLDENDIEDALNELEDYLGFEFEDRNTNFVYVSDLIAFVKAAQ
jgi:hypothetical protein